MKPLATLVGIAALVCLAGCAGAPPARHVTLDDGGQTAARTSATPVVAVVRVSVPELIDRPQLVLRTDGNQVTLSEQYRWAEPLRREIPRLIARDLGELLDSSRVVAMAVDGASVDFKLTLDFQQLEAVVGQGVDVDVIWRFEHRDGRSRVGRSSFRQALEGGAGDAQLALVAAQRQALKRVAAEIGREIAAFPTP